MNDTMSRQTAEKIPFRALTFLRAVGTADGIREALSAAGYTQADNDHAWQLLLNIAGYRVKIAAASNATEASKAIVELDETDEPLLRRAEAVLRRFHPAQADFVFDNLTAGTGAAAVISIGTFLARLDQLQSGPDREATRAEDQAALAALAARGITSEERARLAALVKVAQQVAAITQPVQPVAVEQRDKDLMALRAWYQDWSETARAVIKRRDYLVRLGLSKRKTGKKEEEVVPPTMPGASPGPGPVMPAPGAPSPGPAPSDGSVPFSGIN